MYVVISSIHKMKILNLKTMFGGDGCVCGWVCVCVREREKEKEKERQREREKERKRERERETVIKGLILQFQLTA
jgi:hypothetical protein